MGHVLLQFADLFGLDPLAVVVLALLASICAFVMKTMMPNPWMAFAFYPLLLLSGLLFAGLVTLSGIAAPIEIRIDSDGDYRADWKEVAERLPTIILTGMAGMCATALGIIHFVRSLNRYV